MGRTTSLILITLSCAALFAASYQLLRIAGEWKSGAKSPVPLAQSSVLTDEVEAAAFELADRRWMPIFGVARGEIRTEAPKAPVSLDYTLKGVVATGSMRWAVLTKAGADTLVQEGDILGDGIEVLSIRSEGIEIAVADQTLKLGFAENQPVSVKTVEMVPEKAPVAAQEFVTMLPSAETTHVFFQDMTQADIVAMLQEAEDKRRKKGMVRADR